ncbi:MAG: Amino acid/amide transporter ATP-binding protein 2 family [Bradyrhizobium sp.]|jgi:branched-chain amino acid transport system ATP-binding protein|nr:Amino acid/amide transporter ATP-binding protein 2 family [Bradyrhizobium sp.]MEA2866772.1 branched-chain amino acid transport system ATP-binding protein [Bradyrhizobium sp.]
MLLEVDNLKVSYGNVVAVDDVSLRVEEGCVATVLGANGAGKTSLLNAIMGVTRSQGNVRFAAKTISGWSSALRVSAGMALVPEGRRILLSLSIEENLLMGAYQRRDKEIVADLDKMYDLFPNLGRRRQELGSVLSGGEQQMLAIGRALMARPRLLLMDEPSLGLSPLFVREVFNLIRSLNSAGLAILLVEQNTRMALKSAQYGYVLKLGRLALEADTNTLMRSGDLAKAYLGAERTSTNSARVA